MTLRIYLSGPMDGCTDEEMFGWRNYVKDKYTQYRYHDPARRDYRGKNAGNEKKIVEMDKFDIKSSNVLLACFHKISPGTMQEIIYAWELGNLVLTVNNTGQPHVSPWIAYHSMEVFHVPENPITKRTNGIEDWTYQEHNPKQILQQTLDKAMAFLASELELDRKFSTPRSRDDMKVIE